MKKYFLIVIVLLIAVSCGQSLKEKGTDEYIKEIKDYHTKRIQNLKRPNDWLTLVGLYWLKEGKNTFGSDASNDVVFPEGKIKPLAGWFTLENSTVTVNVLPGVNILSDSNKVIELIMIDDNSKNTTVLEYGSLRWFVIKRGDKYGIRLRDYEAPLLTNFEGINTYPVNDDWKIEAVYEKYEPAKEIYIPTIIGQIDTATAYGSLVFNINGKEYRLDPTEGDNSLFVVFADETSGEETYGAGRFLSVPKPGEDGKTYIDFNKAYNPPCAFTKYATCPLPPDQNKLRVRITAGEKSYGDH